MWYLFYLLILLALHCDVLALAGLPRDFDILLTTIVCKGEEKSELLEKIHTPFSKEIKCSHLWLDEQQEKNIINDFSKISQCNVSFVKNDKNTTLHIQFDPCIVTIHAEKSEDKEGKCLIICYVYDKKIIDTLELHTKKSILQYTFNRPFSLQTIYVKT